MQRKSYEDLIENAAEDIDAEIVDVRNYLSGDPSTVEKNRELGVQLNEELGTVANFDIRGKIKDLVTHLYGDNIQTSEGEISIDEGIEQTYKLLIGYDQEGSSPTSVAAGAVHAAERINAWSDYHSQREIAEAADISDVSLRNQSKSIKEHYVEEFFEQ